MCSDVLEKVIYTVQCDRGTAVLPARESENTEKF